MHMQMVIGAIVLALVLGGLAFVFNPSDSSLEDISTVQEETKSTTPPATSPAQKTASAKPASSSTGSATELTALDVQLTATPNKGTASLTTKIRAEIKVPSQQKGNIIIFFGDGASAVVTRQQGDSFFGEWTRTYTEAKTYGVVLVLTPVSDVDSDLEVLKSPMYAKNTIIKTLPITVTAKEHVQGNFSSYPRAGKAPLAVNFTTTYTYAGAVMANNNVDIDFGDGIIQSLNGACSSNQCFVSHTYTARGTYTVTLRKSEKPFVEGKTYPTCTDRELSCRFLGSTEVVVQ